MIIAYIRYKCAKCDMPHLHSTLHPIPKCQSCQNDTFKHVAPVNATSFDAETGETERLKILTVRNLRASNEMVRMATQLREYVKSVNDEVNDDIETEE